MAECCPQFGGEGESTFYFFLLKASLSHLIPVYNFILPSPHPSSDPDPDSSVLSVSVDSRVKSVYYKDIPLYIFISYALFFMKSFLDPCV